MKHDEKNVVPIMLAGFDSDVTEATVLGKAGLRSEVQSDHECSVTDPCAKWRALTGARIQGKTLASFLHF